MGDRFTMAGVYGQGGFPLAATLAPMRKTQIDTTGSLGLPATINRQIERRAARFLDAQRGLGGIVAATGIEAEMRDRAEQFGRAQQTRYTTRPR